MHLDEEIIASEMVQNYVETRGENNSILLITMSKRCKRMKLNG